MSKWIPVTYRKMTEEEQEYYVHDEKWMYGCELPEDGQDVLITTNDGRVVLTTFYNEYRVCYFEYYETKGEVIAWMPLPEHYTKEGAK